MANYEGYCVKCREKREFDGQEVELANGRRAAHDSLGDDPATLSPGSVTEPVAQAPRAQ